jgi:hypothetical protein
VLHDGCPWDSQEHGCCRSWSGVGVQLNRPQAGTHSSWLLKEMKLSKSLHAKGVAVWGQDGEECWPTRGESQPRNIDHDALQILLCGLWHYGNEIHQMKDTGWGGCKKPPICVYIKTQIN